jgi:hypothetical protein
MINPRDGTPDSLWHQAFYASPTVFSRGLRPDTA